MNWITNIAAMFVTDSGTRIVKKKRIGPAPSMRAASASSSGTVMKNWRNRKVAVADAISGMISPGNVLSSPRSDMTCVGRRDAHLDRQHQRDEDHPEEEVAQREAEVDDRERRQQRDQDLADRDADRHHQAHQHHAADRRARADAAALEQHPAVVLDHQVARHQRHRRGFDRFGRVCRGDSAR